MLLPVWQTPGPRLLGSILLAPGPFLLSHSLKRLFLDFERQKPKILKVYKKSRHQNNALSFSPRPTPRSLYFAPFFFLVFLHSIIAHLVIFPFCLWWRVNSPKVKMLRSAQRLKRVFSVIQNRGETPLEVFCWVLLFRSWNLKAPFSKRKSFGSI